jgi:hypothetical protein
VSRYPKTPLIPDPPCSLFGEAPPSPALLKSRIQALLDMVKANVSILTKPIRLRDHHGEHELYRKSVVPYLMTNRFRPRVRASKKVAQFRTVPRCWDERFLLLVLMQIAFGCFYQGMPKLPFLRPLRRPLWLRSLQLLPLLQMLLLLLLPLLPFLLPLLGLLLQLAPLLLLLSLLLLLVRSARCVLSPTRALSNHLQSRAYKESLYLADSLAPRLS